jgi:predicted DCC family thiol-disulfide oxidoreductase YuxK
MQEHNRPILLFDGLCNLCNGFVNFVLKHDTEKIFLFASLQSKSAQDLLSRFGLQSSQMSSVVLIKGESFYLQSTAALRIMDRLAWPYRALTICMLIPAPIRDLAYTLIAKNRYRIFGKRESCMMPTPELAARFLP